MPEKMLGLFINNKLQMLVNPVFKSLVDGIALQQKATTDKKIETKPVQIEILILQED